LCSEYLDPFHDLSSAPHRAGMYGRHVLSPFRAERSRFYVNSVAFYRGLGP
jgi:hypothetical protein